MSIYRASKLIDKAEEENHRENIYQLYINVYPHFTEKSFLNFEEFYEKFKPQKQTIDTRSKDEILSEILKIENELERRK